MPAPMPTSFKKVLIANRGEIAVRVARTLREMGITSVAVYSEVDRAALHVRMADEAYPIGPAAASESYLRIDKIIDVAKKSGCDAIHPGYGFLSENPLLPEACTAAGIVFIGPPASAMRQMGSKTAARSRMSEAGVPIVPGAMCETTEEAVVAAKKIGFPVMLKAASGGGGKGMRLVERAEDMASAWERARSEAKKFFGDDTVYLEKALIRPRHVEIQVLGDQHGNLVHVFERDCSIQRRNQKVVEETPSPAASKELIAKMGAIAVQGAKAVGYYSAGTFEFLLAEDGQFYFLEMNTRLQVEHPVTELVSGLDLVREMVEVAQGNALGFRQEDLHSRGAAIECRVYAEDPASGFLPSPGHIESLVTPSGPGVRDDGGAYPGCTVSSFYDPLISKLSVWAPTRAHAVERMRRALSEYVVTGIKTNLAFHQRLFRHPSFVAGTYDTGFLEREKESLVGYVDVAPEDREPLAVAIAIAAARMERVTGVKSADEGETGSRLSPWVEGHRARALR
jgi:acetyl-CoA carboxylase biotin carboxylase subunit